MGTRWGLIFLFCSFFSFHTNKQISFVSCSTDACGIGASRGLILFVLLNFFPYFSYFSSSLFEHFFSFVFCIFATCAMGTSRGRHQQSSFPVFLQMQPCISGKSNFFSNTIRSFDHQMSAFVIDIYMCPACNVHSKSTKREVHLCPLRLGQNGILETI